MAESQGNIAYDNGLLDVLERALSGARLAPYLKAANGSRKRAIQWYLWNSRLSKAFLFPLNIAEVGTRNAMHQAISAQYGGPTWIIQPPFPLTTESEASRQRALTRLGNTFKPDDLVAALTFDFWSNLFRRDYDHLWQQPGILRAVFPSLPLGKARSDVQLLVAGINAFRNRIAHHEPIHKADHRKEFEQILQLLGFIDPTLRVWTRQCATVMTIVRTPPNDIRLRPGLPLSSTNTRKPISLGPETVLTEALVKLAGARPPIAIVYEENAYSLLTMAQVTAYVAREAVSQNGLVDLSQTRVRDVLAREPSLPFATIDVEASTGDALAAFFPADTKAEDRPQALVVQAGTEIDGIISHPQIRYC